MYPLLNEAIDDKKFDTRLVDRNVVRGRIAQSEIDSVAKALPDDSENCDFVPVTLESIGNPSGQKIKGF